MVITCNVCIFRDYKYTKSNHNAATWMIFQLFEENMRKMNCLNEIKSDEEFKVFQEYSEEISYSITLLQLNIRNTSFTKDSINKRELESLVDKLEQIFIELDNVKSENANDIKNCINRISEILTRTKGGFEKEGILGIIKTEIIIDNDSYKQLQSEISVLKSLLKG